MLGFVFLSVLLQLRVLLGFFQLDPMEVSTSRAGLAEGEVSMRVGCSGFAVLPLLLVSLFSFFLFSPLPRRQSRGRRAGSQQRWPRSWSRLLMSTASMAGPRF